MKIRQLCFVTTAILILCASADAQVTFRGRVGVSGSKLTTDLGEIITNSDFGYQASLALTIGRPFFIEPGVIWYSRGTELSSNSGTKDDVVWRAIQIPLLLGWRGLDLKVVTIRLNAGPTVAFITQVPDNRFGISKDDISDVIWGIKAGGGVDFLFLSADLNYEQTLNEVLKGEGAKSRSFAFEVGVRFDF